MAIQASASGHVLRSLEGFPAGPLTVSFWLLVTNFPDRPIVLWDLANTATTSSFSLQLRGSGNNDAVQFQYTTGGSGILINHLPITMSVNTWYHFGIIGDTGPSQLWMNSLGLTFATALQVPHTTVADLAYTPQPVALLNRLDPAIYWTEGRIAAYKHWTARLTDAELGAESQTYLPVRTANLWTCMPCLNVAAMRDISAQRHDFTATGLTTASGPPIAWAPTRLWPVLIGGGAPPPTVRSLAASLLGTSTTAASDWTATRALAAGLQASSSTPSSTGGFLRLLTASVAGSTVTPALTMPPLFVRVATPTGANHGYQFVNQTSVLLVGGMHGLGTPALHVGLYDAQIPAQAIQGSVRIDPVTCDVLVTFAQLQSGLVVLNAGHPSAGLTGNFATSFGATTTLTIPGTSHQLATPTLLVAVYDASTPRIEVQPARVTVHPTTFDVTLTFAQSQSGLIVLCGYQGSGGTTNVTVPLPGTTTVSIPEATHGRATDQLVVSVYDATTSRVSPGRVTVHPTTHEVVLTFAQAQAGTVVLNGSVQVGGPVTRLLSAALQGVSVTPVSLVTLPSLRVLVAASSASSLTTDALVTQLRLLLGTLGGVSITPASAVTVLRQFSSTLIGTSLTPDAVSVLTALRSLTAQPLGASTTPPVIAQHGRLLAATVLGASLTPGAAATSVRPVLAALASTSTTSTPTAFVTAVRALSATLSGVSLTPGSVTTASRALTGALVSTSTTPPAVVQHLRPLSATLAGTSLTPPAVVLISTLVSLTATLSASSTTPAANVLLTAARFLTAQLAGASLTPGATAIQVRALSTQVSSVSVTPPAAPVLTTLRTLTANLSASSVTPTAGVLLLRRLSAVLASTSVTPPALFTLARALQAQLTGASLTPLAGVLVPGQVLLTANVLGLSTSPSAVALQQRGLLSATAGTSFTPPVAVTMQRRVAALLAAASVTPSGELRNTVVFQSALSGASVTSAAVPTLTRTLSALVSGLSLTPAVFVQQQRLLQSALQGVSLTPPVPASLVRSLTSLLAGSTVSPAGAHTMARGLVALLTGSVTSAPFMVTTLRPLEATVLGESVIPGVLLIPNSGEMACQASLVGSSQTSESRLAILPPARIGLVGATARVGNVPARPRLAVVSDE